MNRPGSHAVFLLAASPENEPVGESVEGVLVLLRAEVSLAPTRRVGETLPFVPSDVVPG